MKTKIKNGTAKRAQPTVAPVSFSIDVVREAPDSVYGKDSNPKVYWEAPDRAWLVRGDCFAFLEGVISRHPEGCFDMIFADPPYFLSNGGITCHAGQMVSVDKGEWDRSKGPDQDHEFNRTWLGLCQRALKPNGTLWVSGTSHVIYSIGFAMQQLGFKLLNNITWIKTNPPPNLACRYFTHSTETIIWAAKSKKSKHYFDYSQMKQVNRGKQMKDVWEDLPREGEPDGEFPTDFSLRQQAPGWGEKAHGKHPAQKPVALLERILLAGSPHGALVLDPFAGSATTGVAAIRHGRRFVGVELDERYLELGRKRLTEECASLADVGKQSSLALGH